MKANLGCETWPIGGGGGHGDWGDRDGGGRVERAVASVDARACGLKSLLEWLVVA
jgi:hypothetical protein